MVWAPAMECPVPHLLHRDPRAQNAVVGPGAQRPTDRGGPVNSWAQNQLRDGAVTDTHSSGPGEDWGSALAGAAEVLAPYYVEVTEGQKVFPGQQDGVVPWMQGALQALGYEATRSGEFDGATVSALTEWLRLNGGSYRGTFGPEELALMERAMAASISLTEFQENAPGIDVSTLAEYLPHLNASMLKAQITSDTRKAVYIAQLAHESDGFNTLEEYASGRDYEGRTDLGNVHPGDGRRFKGRGPIQITGRSNYQSFGDAIGVDIVSDPSLAATPEVGFQLAAEYWSRHNLNRYADRGQFNTVTERINGGQNGKADRRRRWARAKRVLGKWENTPDVATRPEARPDDLQIDGTTPVPGMLDPFFEELKAGEYEGAMGTASALANQGHEAGEDIQMASLARDLARALTDAQLALEEERPEEAKVHAHNAAVWARAFRDRDQVRSDLADPVIAQAGSLWTRANEAESTVRKAADLRTLEAGLPLRRGSRGGAVEALQRLLGMDAGGGLGTFGPSTERAVIDFQIRHGIGRDGVVGPGTYDKLRIQ